MSGLLRSYNEYVKKNPLHYFYLVGLGSVLLTGFFAFSKLGGAVFFSWDSSSYIAFANELLANGVPLQLGPSYNQSLGNITHPLNFWLIPEAYFSLSNGKINPVLFYLVAAALFYSCAFIMAIMFGFGRWVALIAASAFTLLTLPYSSPVLFTEFFWWHAPFMIPMIYMAFAQLTLYYLVGRMRGLWNVVPVVLLTAVVVWTIVGYPKYSVAMFLGTVIFCLVFTGGAQSWREVAWKMGGAVFVLLVLVLAGPWEFIRGIYGYTGNFIFGNETLNESGSVDWNALLSGLFHPVSNWHPLFLPNLVWVKYHMGYTLPAMALVGAVWTIISPLWPRPAKLIAIGMLVTFPYAFISIYGSVYPNQVYHLLFTLALVPAADLVLRTRPQWTWNFDRIPAFLKRYPALAGAGGVAVVVVIAGMSMHRSPPGGYPYPPARIPVVEFLEKEIGFSMGQDFRGRYISLLLTEHLDGREFASISNTTAMAVAVSGVRLAAKEGNDLTFASLRYRDIPVTIEYNRMTTPLSALFHNILLVRTGDTDRIDYRTITRFDPKLLGLIGVRFVLSAKAPTGPGARVAIDQPVSSRPDVKLYEVVDSNHGQYSPTTLRPMTDVVESIRTLARSDFDPLRQALVHGRLPNQPLIAASDVNIHRIRNGLHVKARSEGRSFVVLPFEFSRCLVVQPVEGKAPESVERTDLILTGVLFERETEFNLNFVFGPFSNQGCRLKDLADVRAMNLGPETVKSLRAQFPSKLIFDGMQ